jgi:ankyrin repeat protein
LHHAALSDDVLEAEARLVDGDDPDAGDDQGFTALHLAAQEGAIDVARLLLDRGVAGTTPMCSATRLCSLRCSTLVANVI